MQASSHQVAVAARCPVVPVGGLALAGSTPSWAGHGGSALVGTAAPAARLFPALPPTPELAPTLLSSVHGRPGRGLQAGLVGASDWRWATSGPPALLALTVGFDVALPAALAAFAWYVGGDCDARLHHQLFVSATWLCGGLAARASGLA